MYLFERLGVCLFETLAEWRSKTGRRLFSKHAVNDYSVSSKMGSPSSFMRSKSAFIKTEGEDEVHSIFR